MEIFRWEGGIAVTFDAQNETGIDWVFYEQPLDLSGEGDSLETFAMWGDLVGLQLLFRRRMLL